MVKLKSKEEVLKEYVSRYTELDNFFKEELSKEYGRYVKASLHIQFMEILAQYGMIKFFRDNMLAE